jgi:hypothetical protein
MTAYSGDTKSSVLQTMLPVLKEAVDVHFKYLDFQGPWVEAGVERKYQPLIGTLAEQDHGDSLTRN